MAASLLSFLFVLLVLQFLLPCTLCFPLCTDSRAPVSLKSPLAFCSYNGSSCCTPSDDSAIKKQFDSMNISDPSCAAIVQSLLCTECDPFSAELFTSEAHFRRLPVLCNSSTASSKQSKASSNSFCTQVWDTCKDIPIKNSLFAPSSQATPSSSSKLSDLWRSDEDFCKAFGGSSNDSSVCYDGKSASFNATLVSPMPKGLCLERIGNGSFLNMAAHPDGSDRVFLTSQAGKVWLATIPEAGSGGTLGIDDSSPFLDITDEVHYDSKFGLMGIAFHPNFTSNGRLFVSFNCDKEESTSCSGRCSCNSDVDCDPAKLSPDSGQPCQYQSVISEFTVNSSSSTPSTATSANPTEVRRIFTIGLPFTSHHGGQILFGPADGYLYFMMGDGGGQGDPMNFAQNKRSLLGKIMRLDVNNMPSSKEISDLGLWGNYSIPKDNPSATDNTFQPEIWAMGLRNPWRCTFDSQRPSYFFCADVGEDTYEEVNLVSKGGNYGWKVYEGPGLFRSTSFPRANITVPGSLNGIFPVMAYAHSSVNKVVGSASIIGGYVYRSSTDPCMFGRYLYADLYGANIWAGTENPEGTGNFTSVSLPFSCAKDSPIPCDAIAGETLPSLGYIYSFGQDNKRDVYVLASKGLYRVVRPSRCSYVCPKENTTDTGNSSTNTPSAGHMQNSQGKSVFLSAVLLAILFFVF